MERSPSELHVCFAGGNMSKTIRRVLSLALSTVASCRDIPRLLDERRTVMKSESSGSDDAESSTSESSTKPEGYEPPQESESPKKTPVIEVFATPKPAGLYHTQ